MVSVNESSCSSKTCCRVHIGNDSDHYASPGGDSVVNYPKTTAFFILFNFIANPLIGATNTCPSDGEPNLTNEDDINPNNGSDRLGYELYAEALANHAISVEKQGSDETLCVGLLGPWGTGKSSIWNLVKKKLEQKDKDEYTPRQAPHPFLPNIRRTIDGDMKLLNDVLCQYQFGMIQINASATINIINSEIRYSSDYNARANSSVLSLPMNSRYGKEHYVRKEGKKLKLNFSTGGDSTASNITFLSTVTSNTSGNSHTKEIKHKNGPGTTELRAEARAQRDNDHSREALMFDQDVLVTLLHHKCEPPISSQLDITDSHSKNANISGEIVRRDLMDNLLKANYMARSTSHLLKATKIRYKIHRDLLGEENEHYFICAKDNSDKHVGNSTTSNISILPTVTNKDTSLESEKKSNIHINNNQISSVLVTCNAIDDNAVEKTSTLPICAIQHLADERIFELAVPTVTPPPKLIDETRNSQSNHHQITDKDVLFGRGGITNKHPGNQNFRDLIQKVKAKYLDCQTNSEKKALSQWIVDNITQGGGIFLKKSNNEWETASENEARMKASQALREGDKIIDPHSAYNQEERKPVMLKKRRSAADNLLYLASNIPNKKSKLVHSCSIDASSTEFSDSSCRRKRDIRGNLCYESNADTFPSVRMNSKEWDASIKSDNIFNGLTRNNSRDGNDADLCGSNWMLKCSDEEHRERFADYYQISPPMEMQFFLQPHTYPRFTQPPNNDFSTPTSENALTHTRNILGGSLTKESNHNLNLKHEYGHNFVCAEDDYDKHNDDSTSSSTTFLSMVTDKDCPPGREDESNSHADDKQIFHVLDACKAIGDTKVNQTVTPSASAIQHRVDKQVFEPTTLAVTAVPNEERCIELDNLIDKTRNSQSNQHLYRKLAGCAHITDKDVLFGRGGITNKHPGNQHFRDLIRKIKAKYLDCQTNSEKKALSQWIVDNILQGGGIFLKKAKKQIGNLNGANWVIASENEARIKASQALREGKKKSNVILI